MTYDTIITLISDRNSMVWAGRDVAYATGGAGMLGVCALVFAGLRAPPKSLHN